MNILIRKIEKCENVGNLVGIISAMKIENLYNDMKVEKPINFTKEMFPQLEQTIIVTKQGNGNLCIEFKDYQSKTKE